MADILAWLLRKVLRYRYSTVMINLSRSFPNKKYKEIDRIAKDFYKYFVDNGFEKNFVYGPLHGTGIIEVEAPWCETSSDYYLKPNMCYQVDTFISGDTFGVRWEKGIAVKEGGFEMLSPEIPEVCPELHF